MKLDFNQALDPLLPEDSDGRLEELATLVLVESSRIGAGLRQEVLSQVSELVRSMNGYYSNLIEGHRTRPQDIQHALDGVFSKDRDRRRNQQLHKAHVEAQTFLEKSLPPRSEITGADWIRRIHREIYERLPMSEWINITGSDPAIMIKPGEFRQDDVFVGRHTAPEPHLISGLMEAFTKSYQSRVRPTASGLIAAVAAHHRFVWIHPFADGNGRVGRLLLQTWLAACDQNARGLWAVSRGLARSRSAYREYLAGADIQNPNGGLDAVGLKEYCRYMLELCLDQVRFMTGLLQMEAFQSRISGLLLLEELRKGMPKGSSRLVKHLLEAAPINRGDVPSWLKLPERTAQRVIQAVVKAGYAKSQTPKGPLQFTWPHTASASLFPGLYPVGGGEETISETE